MKIIDVYGKRIAIVSDVSIVSVYDALDIMADAYVNHCHGVIAPKAAFPDHFFDLSTGLAGEILQKFSTYQIKLAIVGRFDDTSSKSLAAFIRECNRGTQIFFKETESDAACALANA